MALCAVQVLERKALRSSRERRADFSGGHTALHRIMGEPPLGGRGGAGARTRGKRGGGSRRSGKGGGGKGSGIGRGGKGGGGKGRGGKGSGGGRRLNEQTASLNDDTPFQFGYRYSHFFYTMEPRPP
jgi:hypothetical protein